MKKILIISSIVTVTLFSNTSYAKQLSASMNEKIATIINARGYLCAKVTDVQQSSGNVYLVTCTEYRSGDGGKKTYVWNAGTNYVAER